MYRILVDYWAKYCRLQEGHVAWLSIHSKTLVLKRGNLLHEPGDGKDYLYFTAEGLLAAVVWDEQGKDGEKLERRLLFLAPPGFSLLTTQNLYTHKQLPVEIRALRDSTVIRIPVAALRDYHKSCPEATILVNVLREKILKQLHLLALLMSIKNEVKRYQQFEKQCKFLCEITIQQEQADYLNISLHSIHRARGGSR